VEVPEVRFASSDGLRLAYQAFGSGPPLVVVPPLVSNVELTWEHELYRRVYEHTARHQRIVQFDKRGIGLSDRFEQHPTLDQRMHDILAVMDAEGLERASLMGLSEGGLMAQLFAAAHPERVDHLILMNSAAKLTDLQGLESYSDGPLDWVKEMAPRFEELIESWGDEPRCFVEWFCPSQGENESFIRWWGRCERLTATQADFRRQVESIGSLLAEPTPSALDRIRAPTLVLHVTGDRVIPVAIGRLLADRIDGAELVEVPGEDHFLFVMANWREIIDREIEFATGQAVPRQQAQRRLATVLFTDIVDSTTAASSVGDATWREMLDSHDRIAWRSVDQHRGHVIKSTGDGLLATFDTPSSAVACAAELRRELASVGLQIRAGVHAGEVEVRDETDIAGLAVHIAARVEQEAGPGEILVSATMRDLLLGSGLELRDVGARDLKGVEGSWQLFALD